MYLECVVFHRHQFWNNIAQNVDVHGGNIYSITAYVKLLGTANNSGTQESSMHLACKNGSGRYRKMFQIIVNH